MTATSNDGQSHSVQVYTDISAEWVTGNVSQIVSWSTSAGDMITHQAQLVDQTPFVEVGDRIQCKRHSLCIISEVFCQH